MPIDYRNYPPNWRSEIRPRILARDGHRCKLCGLADRVQGWWGASGQFYTPEDWAGGFIPGEDEAAIAKKMLRNPAGGRVVLTIAHLDHALVDHSDANLAALCQRCHLRYDKAVVAPKAAYTRKYGRATQSIEFLP